MAITIWSLETENEATLEEVSSTSAIMDAIVHILPKTRPTRDRVQPPAQRAVRSNARRLAVTLDLRRRR